MPGTHKPGRCNISTLSGEQYCHSAPNTGIASCDNSGLVLQLFRTLVIWRIIRCLQLQLRLFTGLGDMLFGEGRLGIYSRAGLHGLLVFLCRLFFVRGCCLRLYPLLLFGGVSAIHTLDGYALFISKSIPLCYACTCSSIMDDKALASRVTESGFFRHAVAPKAVYFSAVRSSIPFE